MNTRFDILVLGLGAAGSSALYHLSKTNKKIAGIDQFIPPHANGSSHGQSRITRQAYHEDPLYVPFIKKAYELWDEVEQNQHRRLFLKTAGIMLGSADASVIKGAELSAQTHDIPYEFLSTAEINRRFPAFKTDEGTVGVLEKNAGILFPEECIKAHLELAARNGAEIFTEERVLKITANDDEVEVITNKTIYTAARIIIAAGAWLNELLPGLQLPLTVERQVLYWFNSPGTTLPLGANALPVYIWEYAAGKMFYGFPDLGDGIKVAHHHAGQVTDPHTLNRQISQDEITAMEDVVKKHFNIKPVFNYGAVCMYTNTPNERFIIDRHPQYKNIIVASPCSGHGFKFASVTGKLLSELALNETTTLDISVFSIGRQLS